MSTDNTCENKRCLCRPAKDIKKKSEILNYEVKRPLPIKTAKSMRDELGERIKKEVVLKPNMHNYLTDDC